MGRFWPFLRIFGKIDFLTIFEGILTLNKWLFHKENRLFRGFRPKFEFSVPGTYENGSNDPGFGRFSRSNWTSEHVKGSKLRFPAKLASKGSIRILGKIAFLRGLERNAAVSFRAEKLPAD